jgi:dolichyl-phosphate-mannose--protein O-mannosyl transferase
MAFVTTTTLIACYLNIVDNFWPLTSNSATATQGYVNSILTVIIMACAIAILAEALRRWYHVLVLRRYTVGGKVVSAVEPGFVPPEYGCS